MCTQNPGADFQEDMNKDKVILLCLQPHKSFRGREFSHFTEQVVAKFPQRVLLPGEHLKMLGKVIATAASEVTQQGKGREGEARKGTTPPDPRGDSQSKQRRLISKLCLESPVNKNKNQNSL